MTAAPRHTLSLVQACSGAPGASEFATALQRGLASVGEHFVALPPGSTSARRKYPSVAEYGDDGHRRERNPRQQQRPGLHGGFREHER